MAQTQKTVHKFSEQKHRNSQSELVDHGFDWYANAQQHVLEQERKARGAGHQYRERRLPEQYVATTAEFRYYQALSWARDGLQQQFTEDEFACMVSIANTVAWDWVDSPDLGRLLKPLEAGSADDSRLTKSEQKSLAKRLRKLQYMEAAALIDLCEVLTMQGDPASFTDALIPLGFELKPND
jgi:hypothetical protein